MCTGGNGAPLIRFLAHAFRQRTELSLHMWATIRQNSHVKLILGERSGSALYVNHTPKNSSSSIVERIASSWHHSTSL